MKRALAAAAILFAVAMSSAATGKVPLEIWGVDAGDVVTIDGSAQVIKGGARVFTGDPGATNAPVFVELATGKHEIVVRHGDCAPRTWIVDLEGASKHAIVLEKEDPERCGIPLLPTRR